MKERTMETKRKIELPLYLNRARKMIEFNRYSALLTNSVYMEKTKYGIR